MTWEQIQEAIRAHGLILSRHAQHERVAEGVNVDEILQALLARIIVEDYPTHTRGSCCLVYGQTEAGRDLHVVVTSTLVPVLVITVYEPTAPRWTTPVTRGTR